MLKFEWDKEKAAFNLAKHGVSFEEAFMSKDDEMRSEYRREDLGKGVRGKYFSRYSKGTNLVLLNDSAAKAFPSAEAVNEALLGLLALAEKTTRITKRSIGRTAKRRTA